MPLIKYLLEIPQKRYFFVKLIQKSFILKTMSLDYKFTICIIINHKSSKMEHKDIIKVIHDGIVGLIYLGSVAGADQFGISFIWIAVATAILQILSPITKF